MNRLTSKHFYLLALLISAVLHNNALAHELDRRYTHVISGDTCHVRNPTTENAASLRRIDGMLQNTSEDLASTVSCAVPIIYDGRSPVAEVRLEATIYI